MWGSPIAVVGPALTPLPPSPPTGTDGDADPSPPPPPEGGILKRLRSGAGAWLGALLRGAGPGKGVGLLEVAGQRGMILMGGGGATRGGGAGGAASGGGAW